MFNYIAVIHKQDGSDYGVSFPDFDGCITAGKTVDEAKDMAQEALQLHVDGMIDDGEQLPSPMSLEEAREREEYPETVVAYFIISIKQNRNEIVRFNASMQSELLQHIDEFTKQSGMSRSGFLAMVSKEYFKEHEKR